jgi:4-amino-4-deoxy-L-arabinose transferase-like glycosyltransferase
VGRRWLALVLVLFCLPLFVGLGGLDLGTDEAIYSFAVDRILETGDWLQPRSSPSETEVFLEKPPLKFWIVAAPIKAGLLPHDEFGLRFWDVVMGGAAFLYVLALGIRLGGAACGLIAVLLLFVHRPLLFDHGLRTNNMEAALLLAYCGGIYHFIRWAAAEPERRTRHAIATGLFFALGFMTKFVAVVFLPIVLAGPALLDRHTRGRLAGGWRAWMLASFVALALIAPWFVYAQWTFGSRLWDTMFGAHVYQRFTTGLDPTHQHPWFFYPVAMWEQFAEAGLQWIVAAGLAVLGVQAVRRRWFEATVILAWAIVPVVLISLGSSKIYHYVFPFLPPLALAGGYLAALVLMLAPVQVRRLGELAEDGVARYLPRLAAAAARTPLRRVATVLIWSAAALALAVLVIGPVRLGIGGTLLLKTSGVARPVAVILIAAVLARRSARVSVLVTALVVGAFLPFSQYRSSLEQLRVERHPLRDASDCLLRVEAGLGAASPGLYFDSNGSIWHPIYYYLRRVQPWTRQETPSAARLAQTLHDPGFIRPSLVQDERYHTYLTGPDAAQFNVPTTPPMIGLREYALLLPGPYAVCSPEAALLRRPAGP